MKAKFTISLVFPTNHRTDNYIALSNMNISVILNSHITLFVYKLHFQNVYLKKKNILD